MLIVPVVLPALLLAEPFLVLWIRDFATEEVVLAFRILVLAFALPAFAVPLSNVLAGVGRSDLLARFAWLTVVVLFVSSALLVPRLGLVGAALAMLCANSTTFLFSRIGKRTLQLGPAAGRARLGRDPPGLPDATRPAHLAFLERRFVGNAPRRRALHLGSVLPVQDGPEDPQSRGARIDLKGRQKAGRAIRLRPSPRSTVRGQHPGGSLATRRG